MGPSGVGKSTLLWQAQRAERESNLPLQTLHRLMQTEERGSELDSRAACN